LNTTRSTILKEKLTNLAKKPGVYLFKDKKNEIIYVGKAKILRNRVRSYFQKTRILDPKSSRLVSKIIDLETIVTDSEVEALILEANLIKEHKPRYNINLKDDKSFPYIRVTNDLYPRIFPTRKLIRDGSRYFGPYTDVCGMRELLKTIKRIFPVRSCNLLLNEETISKGKYKVCLDYHIKRCFGPCENLIALGEYRDVIEHVVDFIQGHSKKIENELKSKINQLAKEMRFEEAARLRDQFQSIEIFKEKQKIVDPSFADRDIISNALLEDDGCCVVFKIRDGKIIGRQHFYLQKLEQETDKSLLAAFLKQYYLRADYVPKEIILPYEIDEKLPIQKWLSQKQKVAVKLLVPKKGDKFKILKMAQKNAKLLLDEMLLQKMSKADYLSGSVKALKDDLALKDAPKRIEGFDISNIQGTNPVASMVCFVNGTAVKGEYRRFNIKIKSTPDDFAMMHEAVGRRYSRLKKENKPMPDLILIDGGKGQLSAACSALKKMGLEQQPIIALAKRLDEIFKPDDPNPYNIKRDSAGLRLLQRVRDESHRFAITAHRQLRTKRTLVSVLDKIEGIGPNRRDALLKHFGSIKNIKAATKKDLQNVVGISSALAREVWEFFHPSSKH
jgi:excinuclease ABC subunit C